MSWEVGSWCWMIVSSVGVPPDLLIVAFPQCPHMVESERKHVGMGEGPLMSHLISALSLQD